MSVYCTKLSSSRVNITIAGSTTTLVLPDPNTWFSCLYLSLDMLPHLLQPVKFEVEYCSRLLEELSARVKVRSCTCQQSGGGGWGEVLCHDGNQDSAQYRSHITNNNTIACKYHTPTVGDRDTR